ncbi:MAG: ABC transporter permease [Candidatus Cloacimonetes bacterium]|jgi:ABC-2 type transport system permease protein|nr:ABC transporter permease [Candidatus Cloacimonadota bacterium]
MNTVIQSVQRSVDPALEAALSRRHAPVPAGAVRDTLTFAWRALLKAKHMPEQVFDVLVTPVMFTVLFTFMFGGALAGSPAAYLQFLLPGILVQTVTFTTVYTGFTLNTDISRGVYDRFKSMPIWQPAPVVGAMAGDTVRYTLSSVIVVLIGLLLGYRPATGVVGVIASIVLLNVFAFGIGWIFTAVALWVKSPSTVLTLSWLVIMPLTFASNIYVDPATMPGWLQAFVAVNPVTHIVTATRGLLDGNVTVAAIALSMITPAIVTLLCAPVAMRLYRRER